MGKSSGMGHKPASLQACFTNSASDLFESVWDTRIGLVPLFAKNSKILLLLTLVFD
mgnify:CR=1 FL=1|tara:strand:+ start:834 stop:1001 length:168 start_codon:yes stop_codon:yes gene_type:complete